MKSRRLFAGAVAGSIMLASGAAAAQMQPVQPAPQPVQAGFQGGAVMVAPQPMPMVAPGVTIVPEARNGRPAPIQISGPMPAGCPSTPCQVQLAPGTYNLQVLGSGGFTRPFAIQGLPSTVEYRQRHSGRLVGGIIELAVGAPFAIAGVSLAAYGFAFIGTGWGWIVLIPAVICLAVGIPLTIVGALNVANSGPAVTVRPGGMMMGRNRGPGLLIGTNTDTVNGGAYQMVGVTF